MVNAVGMTIAKIRIIMIIVEIILLDFFEYQKFMSVTSFTIIFGKVACVNDIYIHSHHHICNLASV